MECSQVTELLPWFANGSLAPEEAESIARHLDECAGCRHELSETGAAIGIFGAHLDEHLPPAVLVGMAFDGATEPASRAAAESHLAGCPSCAEQLELVRDSRRALAEIATEIDDEGLPAAPERAPAAERDGRLARFPTARREPSATPWRRLAIAASIAALVSTVGWLSSWPGSGGPERVAATFRGDADDLPDGGEERPYLPLRDRLASAAGAELNVPIVRAEPRDRAAADEEVVNRVPVGASGVVLVLSSRLTVGGPLGCRLETAEGVEIWTRQGLERRPEGGYTLRFSTDRLDRGGYTLRLLAADGLELESYPLSLE